MVEPSFKEMLGMSEVKPTEGPRMSVKDMLINKVQKTNKNQHSQTISKECSDRDIQTHFDIDLDSSQLQELQNFRTDMCDKGQNCEKKNCWKAHEMKDLRKPSDLMTADVVDLAKRALLEN